MEPGHVHEEWLSPLAGLSGHRRTDPWSCCSPGRRGLLGLGGLRIPGLTPGFQGQLCGCPPDTPRPENIALGSGLSVVPLLPSCPGGTLATEDMYQIEMGACGQAGPWDSDPGKGKACQGWTG